MIYFTTTFEGHRCKGQQLVDTSLAFINHFDFLK